MMVLDTNRLQKMSALKCIFGLKRLVSKRGTMRHEIFLGCMAELDCQKCVVAHDDKVYKVLLQGSQ